jgi:TetR/AcrR family tetracycline transcriptional repressor
VTARRGKGGRPAQLSVERIVTAAVELVDAEGLDALTMRALGERLGVAAMSLYRHLPNREAVLATVVNRLFGDALADFGPDGDWPATVVRFANAYRRMLLAHPRAAPLLATHPVDVDIALIMLAEALDQFAAAHIRQEDALMIFQSVGAFVLGHALAQTGAEQPADDPYYDQWFTTGLHAMVAGFELAAQSSSRNGPTSR